MGAQLRRTGPTLDRPSGLNFRSVPNVLLPQERRVALASKRFSFASKQETPASTRLTFASKRESFCTKRFAL